MKLDCSDVHLAMFVNMSAHSALPRLFRTMTSMTTRLRMVSHLAETVISTVTTLIWTLGAGPHAPAMLSDSAYLHMARTFKFDDAQLHPGIVHQIFPVSVCGGSHAI